MKINPNKIRIIQTFNMNLCYFSLGLLYSLFGATLLDLSEIYNATTEVISYTITTRAVGSLVGGLAGGVVYKFVNAQLVAAGCSLLLGLGTILIPNVPSVMFMHVVTFIIGNSITLFEVGCHVWIQVIWKDRSGPQFQLFNLVYGIGGILAPLICEPFLSPKIQRLVITSGIFLIIVRSMYWTSVNSKNYCRADSETMLGKPVEFANFTTYPSAEETSGIPGHSQSRVHIACAILGAPFILCSIFLLISHFFDKTDPKPSKEVIHSKDALPCKQQYLIVAIAAAYECVGVASEIGLATYIPTFVVLNENLNFSKSSAALLSSVFWTSFTASRVLATFLTFKLSPVKLMIFFHLILVVSQLFVSFFINYSPWIAWIGFASLAFGLSPYYGNVIVWSVQYIQLTHAFMSVIMVSACVSATLPSLFIGRYIDNWPMIMVHGHASFAGLLTLLALTMIVYGRTPLLRKRIILSRKE